MKHLIILAALISMNVNAEQKIYYTYKGQTVSPDKAILAAIRGEEVYKCQNVEAKVSKSGTSIGLKNVKKAKAE